MSSYLSDILTAIKLAHWVYETGFSKLARDRSGHESYIKFQTEINVLKGNLENLQRVIQNAQQNRERIASGETDTAMGSQDDTALRQVCGEFNATLEDCQTFMQRNSGFKYYDDFVVNLEWNFLMEHRIKELRSQIQYHNLKVQSVLLPLEIQLQTNIEQLVRRTHVDTAGRMDRHQHQIIQRLDTLNWLLGGELSNGVDETVDSEADLLDVPTQLAECFSNIAEEERPECSNPDTFPFELGTDALVRHLQEGTKNFQAGPFINEKTPDPLQYIQLAKCIWLVDKLKASIASSSPEPPKLLITYFHQLELEVKEQCARFKRATPERDRLQEPDLETVLRCPEESFRIWFDRIMQNGSEEILEKGFMDELLDVELPDSSAFSEHRLSVLRSEFQLKIVDSTKATVGKNVERHVKHDEMNLKTLVLTPLYALPSSAPNAFNIKLNALSGAGKGFPISFQKLKHVLQLQHALTGYYVAFDKSNVKTICYIAGSLGRGTRIREEGRLQLWIPKRKEPEPQHRTDGPRSSRRTLSNDSNSPGPLYSMFSSSRTSTGNLSTASTCRTYRHQYSTLALNGDTPNKAGPRTAIMHEKPNRPMLVFYLQNEKKELSFLTVKLDNRIRVNRDSCSCGKPDNQCTRSSLEQTNGGCFEACRYSTGNDVGRWNVAALGEYQEGDPRSGGEMVKSLKWILISFDQLEDRAEFAGSFCRCGSKKDKIPQCRRDHYGVMGQAQFSYLQKLDSYHKRNNDEPDVVFKKD